MSADRPPRPEPIAFESGPVPNTLTDRDSWVCWRYRWDADRDEWTKVPVDPSTGGFASSTDPDTWGSFADAVAYHDRDETDSDGVGFVVHDEDTVVGLDLDDCRDPDTGDVAAWTRDLLDDVPTYAEVSPSGTGLRLFGLGFVPDGGTRADVPEAAGHVEMYDTARYLTVTGQRVDDSPTTVEQVNEEIGDVHAEYIADDHDDTDESADASPAGAVGLDDHELIEKAKNAENGDKFHRLWRGDTSGYESHSEARQALANLLAFWTGGDEQRMLRLFRQSSLCRGDDDIRTFENYETPTSLDGRTDFYDPPKLAGNGSTDTSDGDGSDDADGWAYVREQYENAGKPDGRLEAANQLEELTSWMYVTDSERLWVYDADRGYFVPRGADVARRRLEEHLREHFSRHEAKEVISRLKARNQTQRAELNGRTRDDQLLCVGNGVLNLRTGDLRDHNPGLKFTRGLSWDYDPDRADPDRVLSFLDDVTQREADRDTLLDHLAHGLMPGHPYRAFVVMYGKGSNGKTKVGDVIQGFVGEENAAAVELQDLTGDDSFATGGLPGAFVNIGDDISVGEVRETSILKSATGGGTIRANEKYEKKFDFENEAAMFFSANEPPRFRERTAAINDRLYPIEMPYRFVDGDEFDPDDPLLKRKDPGVAESLTYDPAAMRGLLVLAVEHAQTLIERDGRYSMPETPTERRAMYEAASDPIKRFALDYLEPGDGSTRVGKDDAYAVYTEMCEQIGERGADESTFKQVISSMATLDTESTQTRTLTPGDGRVYAWKYLTFSDDAKALMSERLQRRYFDNADPDRTTADSEDVAFDATRIADAAKSLTGYVTVTVEVANVDRFGEEDDKTTKAVVCDESGAIDFVTWDDDVADTLAEHEEHAVVIENAEVGEHKGTRQLQANAGVTTIRRIQHGVGYTDAPTADGSQGDLSRAAPDGGEEPDDATGKIVELIRNHYDSGDLLTAARVAGQTDLAPQTARDTLNTIQAERRLLGPASDGWQVL